MFGLTALAASTSLLGQTARAPACRPDHAGLTVPAGFCVVIVADSVGAARHLTVAPNGDVYVALARNDGGILALRDTDGDGVADVRERLGPGSGGAGIELRGEWLYFAPNDAVVRYRRPPGVLRPPGAPDTVVHGLPADRSHTAKTFAFGADGALYVNIGSPSNVCAQGDRAPDPCPELEARAGIWRFDQDRTGQTQADGRRWATGLRNTVAITQRPQDGAVYGGVHGRDRLQGWTQYYTDADGAELPAEVFVRIEDGDDYGWPYCYYDHRRGRYVLAPEYGGDGQQPGRCASVKAPVLAFPGHWAPDGTLFYTGSQFPSEYRDGLFIAFHGSWNRAPLPQQGATVLFAPFQGLRPAGSHRVFADGFGGPGAANGQWSHRPVGLAQAPDGSLYVTDDRGGRIYRIYYLAAR